MTINIIIALLALIAIGVIIIAYHVRRQSRKFDGLRDVDYFALSQAYFVHLAETRNQDSEGYIDPSEMD